MEKKKGLREGPKERRFASSEKVQQHAATRCFQKGSPGWTSLPYVQTGLQVQGTQTGSANGIIRGSLGSSESDSIGSRLKAWERWTPHRHHDGSFFSLQACQSILARERESTQIVNGWRASDLWMHSTCGPTGATTWT